MEQVREGEKTEGHVLWAGLRRGCGADWLEDGNLLFLAESLAAAIEENAQINSTFQRTLQDLNTI